MYDIEDIAWESVRRNFDYKRAYNSFLSSGLDASNLYQYRFDDSLTKQQKEIVWEMISRWKLSSVFDPNISSDELTQTDLGRTLNGSKPYYSLFVLNKMDIVEFDSKVFVNEGSGQGKSDIIQSERCRHFFEFLADHHDDRFLLSIDCLGSDKDILQEIKKLKHRVGREIKNRKAEEEKNIKEWKKKYIKDKECVFVIPKSVKNIHLIHPNKLEESYNHLERYDSVVKDVQSKYENWKSLIVDGVLIPPPEYRISENVIQKEKGAFIRATNVDEKRLAKGSEKMIENAIKRNKLTPESKRRSEKEVRESYIAGLIDDYAKETVTGYYVNSYEKAASMIHLAPNRIRLQAKRVEK